MTRSLALGLVVLTLVSRASAVISVSAFQTVAHTNAYAPVDQSTYYSTQTLSSISPASASVLADWTGTNIGGTTTTWRWRGSAQISTTTSFNSSALSITGSGSYSFDLTTTAGFIDPTRVATVYGPGSVADYQCYFRVTTPTEYKLSITLGQWGSVRLGPTVAGGVVVERINLTGVPLFFGAAGTLMPGDYGIRANAGIGPPSGLPNGLNREVGNGAFDALVFSAQVPEPLNAAIGAVFVVTSMQKRRPRVAR